MKIDHLSSFFNPFSTSQPPPPPSTFQQVNWLLLLLCGRYPDRTRRVKWFLFFKKSQQVKKKKKMFFNCWDLIPFLFFFFCCNVAFEKKKLYSNRGDMGKINLLFFNSYLIIIKMQQQHNQKIVRNWNATFNSITSNEMCARLTTDCFTKIRSFKIICLFFCR